jgi:organic radical activating enzyme
MRTLHNLEIHVAHGCNLACESCSHYSNHAHKGMLSLAQADEWMRPWAWRLRPKSVSLLGGEPTINPELTGFIPLTRGHFPDAQLRLVTNGFFLERHPDLPKEMVAAGNAMLYVSVHHESPEYAKKLAPVLALLNEWKAKYKLPVTLYLSAKGWTRRYHGFGSTMEPYKDNNPRKSWETCVGRTCTQLFEGKIWKCPPLAYLPMQNEKYKLSESWAPYLKYQPLPAESTDAEMNAFFDREEEAVCGMCPAKPERLVLPLPLRKSAVA